MIVVVVAVVVGVLVFVGPSTKSSSPPPSSATPTTTPPPAAPVAGSTTDVMQLAATMTHSTPLDEVLPTSLLRSTISWVGVTLYGDGMSDPEPSPGSYDWSSLDARIHQVSALNMPIVLKVFNAPGWMKAMDRPMVAVSPSHIQDFANLAVATAKRYPQIHYFQIWNEMWGYRSSTGPWDYAGYTDLYNAVYRALKSYNPSLQVGGPYAPFPLATSTQPASSLTGPWGSVDQNALDTVTYWLQHKAGADFLVVDGRTDEPTRIPSQPAAATEVFATITRWIRSQTNLPIWWNEWYAESPQLGPSEWDAVSAEALLQLASSGAAFSNLYQAEYVNNLTAFPNLVKRHGIAPTPGLWLHGSSTPTALAPVFQELQGYLYGTSVHLYSPTSGVEALSNGTHFVAVDVDGAIHTVSIDGQSLTLQPWQIATG